MESTAKMGHDGRIVVPAAFRKQLHLLPGHDVILKIENDELHIFSLEHALKKARSLVAKHAKKGSLVEKLKAQRLEDAADE